VRLGSYGTNDGSVFTPFLRAHAFVFIPAPNRPTLLSRASVPVTLPELRRIGPTLRVLGSAQLLDEHGNHVALPAKALALLTYLRIATTRRAHRAFLADLLWSEVDEEKGRASLRQAVMAIRQVLGDDALIANGHDIELVRSPGCDADEFIAIAARGDYAAAVEVYQGDFFVDFAVPGAHGFEVWATIERERQRGAFLRSADAATQQLLDAGRARSAAELASRLVSADQLRERSWRLRLEALLTMGDLAGARVDAESMRAVLHANEVQLEPATEKLLLRLQRTELPASGPGDEPLRAELVGRTRAFSALLDAWKLLGSDGVTVRALTGDAGLGKTRLLDELAVRLRSLGARVVRVDARYGDQEIPYALMQQLVDALVAMSGAAGIAPESVRTLVALEPRIRRVFESAEPEAVSDVDLPLRRSTALADLVVAVSDERSIAVLIDDAHWADHASLHALFAAIARDRRARVLLVIAYRPSVLPGFSGVEIPLDALDAESTRELLESILSLRDAAWAAALAGHLAAAARGVPLLLLESIRLLEQERLLTRSEAAWECPDPDGLLRRLRTLDVLRERLALLDAELRDKLLRMALVGGEMQETLLVAAGITAGASGVLQRLAQGGWIARADGHVSVRHAEIARTAIESATPDELRAARATLARALATSANLSDAEWRLRARLAIEDKNFSHVNSVVDDWIGADPRNRRVGGWRGAVSTLLGGLASPGDVREIGRMRPWRDRLDSSYWRIPFYATLFAGMAGVVGFAWHQRTTPTGLRFVSTPISGTTIGMTPLIAVEVVNRHGDVIRVDGDTVHVSMSGRDALLEGETTAITKAGVAVFPNLRISGSSASNQVIQAQHGSLRSESVRLLSGADIRLAIRSIRVMNPENGAWRGDTLSALAGKPVAVELQLGYTSPYNAASMMAAAVPAWPSARQNPIELGPFATPTRDGTRYATFSFVAPETIGNYRIFLVLAAESDGAHIASATNWAVGAPIWNDGNDIADWGEPQAIAARQSGHVAVDGWRYTKYRGPALTDVGAAVIAVRVTPSLVGAAARTPAASSVP
jgi:DNA-binding SARP family transcriptional activator